MENPKKALLLVNLGSPDSPSPSDVSLYLKEFLMDRHVITMPALFRWLLVHGIIAPFRSKKSAHAYQSIWNSNPDGSPLVLHTEDLSRKVGRLAAESFAVDFAMRYGAPSIESKIKSFLDSGVQKMGLIPLYPQYANSTFFTVVESVQKALSKWDKKHQMELNILDPFYNHPDYLSSLFQSLAPHLEKSNWDHFILSFHGLPLSHLKQTEGEKNYCATADFSCCHNINEKNSKCYRAQCHYIAQAVSKQFNIPEDKYTLCFQSRLGRSQWIEPYTVQVIESLAKRGVKKIVAASPSFVADCLETLEEMAIQNAQLFKSFGGKSFTQIPALNSEDYWAKTVFQFGQGLLNPKIR